MVVYCISHNNDYKGTEFRYDVSYSQVYSWVKKSRKDGECGLEDKRGHHKGDDEEDEPERLRRENKRLKQQLDPEHHQTCVRISAAHVPDELNLSIRVLVGWGWL